MPDRFLWFYLFFIYLLAIKILTLFDSIFTFFTNFYPGGVIVLVLTFSRFPACVASPNSLTHPIIEKQAKNISFFGKNNSEQIILQPHPSPIFPNFNGHDFLQQEKKRTILYFCFCSEATSEQLARVSDDDVGKKIKDFLD